MTTVPILSLLVIRAADPAALAEVYELFGCRFQTEQHGNGPVHFSAVAGETVLEIYPRDTDAPNTAGVRLGFVVADLDSVLSLTERAGVRTIMPAEGSRWGRRAVVIDPEGHRIELTEGAARPLP